MKLLKAIFLYPVSLLYGMIVKIRNFMFNHSIILKSKEFDIPVITVGNISVGGTGKTPAVEYLIELLKGKHKIAVLSRGYKRKTKGFVLADKNAGVETIGDEPYQIYLKYPEVTVAVDEKRVRGIQKLTALKKDIDLIILDDAFQHRYVKPALSLLLIDYTQPFFKDKYLPFGRMRDNPEERYRAELILVTKTPADVKPIDMRIIATEMKLKPYQSLYFASIEYEKLVPVFDKGISVFDTDTLKNKQYSILLVTGIGNPKPIINYCKEITENTEVMVFPDHHQFTEKDFEKIKVRFNSIKNSDKIIVTTEKDALRFQKIKNNDPEFKKFFFWFPIKMKILNEDEKEFNKLIMHYIEKSNAQYRFLSTKKNF